MSLFALIDESEKYFTFTQIELIESLLCGDAASATALQKWADSVDIDALDAASYRLIPALYARAGASPALAALRGRMKGIYRYYFYRNNRFLTFVEKVLASLLAQAIEFIVFKGTAIQLQYHHSAALRSFGDCDILVHKRDKARCEAVLAGCGLGYRYDPRQKGQDRHSHDFVDAAGNGIDLHWFALFECCDEGIDDGFWQRSRQIEWRGLRLRVLAPEDALLVAGVNGIREVTNARADWIFDAWLILKALPEFDWRLLHDELTGRGLNPHFMDAMGLLYRFVPHFPAAMVEKEFGLELKRALERRVAENRTFAIEPWNDSALTALLKRHGVLSRAAEAMFGVDRRARLAASGDIVRHLRYDLHDDGSVSRLDLHRDFRRYLAKIFDVSEPVALKRAENHARRRDELSLRLPAGLLRPPAQVRPQRLNAELQVNATPIRFDNPEIGSVTIKVRVINRSNGPWHVFPGSENTFGLSYHLVRDDESVVAWDCPRVNFLTGKQNQVAMLMPGDSLRLDLMILRPPEPGRYQARLDIVHERVAWASEMGQHFPQCSIQVF